MKNLWIAFVMVAASALPALSAPRQFDVELFSRQTVRALSLTSAGQSAAVCGTKTDGPCWVVRSGQRISCFADRLIHCRLGAADRHFRIVNVTGPVRFAPEFAPAGEPPTFLMQSARITVSGERLQIFARVDLEAYVSGVLRGEASVLQAPAARDAMAILARTWALRWQGRHHDSGFDFCSLTHCQVFRLPQQGETGALDPAVLATRGQVLQYHGALADPYFTACCGGMTEAAGSVWPDRAQPYLISIHDPYCAGDRHASWTNALPAESVLQVLREDLRLPLAAPLEQFSVEHRDSSGRAMILRVVAGSAWKIDANQFRYALDRRLGWQQIKSNFYTVKRQGDSWLLVGHGLGHGVGLCQAGAEQMARLGSSTEHILNTYFPGTNIATQPSEDADPVASSEHFQLAYPDSQGPWVRQTLATLEAWRRELGPPAQVLPSRTRVQTWTTVSEFINATGEPGWLAGSSDGNSITLQPLDLLARKRILDQSLRHELTHLVVHRLAAKGVPRWFEEGWVLYLTGERIDAPATQFTSPQELEQAVVRPHSEAATKAAYAQSLARVRQFVNTQGDAAVWRLIEHPSANDLRWLAAGQSR